MRRLWPSRSSRPFHLVMSTNLLITRILDSRHRPLLGCVHMNKCVSDGAGLRCRWFWSAASGFVMQPVWEAHCMSSPVAL
jgi:hypothetical protein